MNILHLISSSGLLGAERVLLEIADQSRRAGLKVTVGVLKNSQNPNLELAEVAKGQGFDVKIFPCNGRFDKKTIQMIRDDMVNKSAQILHSHNYKSNFYARAALSDNNIRWVVTNHGRRSGPKLFFYNFLDGFIVRRADRVIAVSREITKKMELIGIPSPKICLIENGVNLDRYKKKFACESIRESLGIKKDTPVIGTVGALTREKGHVYLLNAVPRVIRIFPKAVFLFVGDGRERASLEKTASHLGIKNSVAFAGVRNDVPEILSILDVFVLPSFREGLPLALLEAQAAQIPAVATRVGAIPDVLKDGVSGILTPPKDSQAIAEAIIMVLSDKQLASGIAQKGFEKVRDNFSSEKMGNKYLSVYKELIEGTGCRGRSSKKQYFILFGVHWVC